MHKNIFGQESGEDIRPRESASYSLVNDLKSELHTQGSESVP